MIGDRAAGLAEDRRSTRAWHRNAETASNAMLAAKYPPQEDNTMEDEESISQNLGDTYTENHYAQPTQAPGMPTWLKATIAGAAILSGTSLGAGGLAILAGAMQPPAAPPPAPIEITNTTPHPQQPPATTAPPDRDHELFLRDRRPQQ